MSIEENKANERRLYDDVFNKGDLSLIPALVSPDFVTGNSRGHEGYKQMVSMWRTAIPDIRFNIDEMVAEGDHVAYRLSVTGTGAGEMNGINFAGKKIDFPMTIFTTYKDGKVASGIATVDTLNLYRQAGVMPPGFESASK